MTCAEATRLIGPWLDDELDVRSTVELEGHLGHCTQCGRERDELLALRATARERLPAFDAPPELEAKIWRMLGEAAAPPPRPAKRWLREGALVAVAASLAFAVSSVTFQGRAPDLRREEFVDAHLRSLQPAHLTDVASSDRHTVKPWFQGKLDYAVPVRDFPAEGFNLVGGRLDFVGGRPVAALVYGRRQHLLNLFVWPATGGDAPVSTRSVRGYREASWAQGGFEYRLVSDVSPPEADKLVSLLRSPEG
jgi:anti-sigma factor RsiW